MQFKGSKEYVSTDDLSIAVNAAINLEKPLLVKGEPGTGKTELARQISKSLNLEIIEWNIKSTTKAQQGLYEYDAVTRLRDSQLYKDKIDDISRYIKKGKIWQSFESEQRAVLLIDEIDKADIEFPNDLLQELDKMEFHVYETGETIRAKKRPIVIITSNNEKDLPEAFLRRCFFHYINFPNVQTLKKIVHVHYPDIKKNLLDNALKIFFEGLQDSFKFFKLMVETKLITICFFLNFSFCNSFLATLGVKQIKTHLLLLIISWLFS